MGPFDQDFDARYSEGDSQEFFKGVREALIFQKSGRLPSGFADAMKQEVDVEARPKPKPKARPKNTKVGAVLHTGMNTVVVLTHIRWLDEWI